MCIYIYIYIIYIYVLLVVFVARHCPTVVGKSPI